MLIFVSGLSGAGKTTMVGAALQAVPGLSYLQTVTTRPMRAGEDASFEYKFVDDAEYETLRAASEKWDHTEYNGFKYGADVEAVNRSLHEKADFICCVAPDLLVIQAMKEIYGVTPLTIWIDTPAGTAKQRTAEDEIRAARQEDARLKHRFNRIFPTTGHLEEDTANFVRLIRHVLGFEASEAND
jgi:guanylate kinase